jgi:hypothetical protein
MNVKYVKIEDLNNIYIKNKINIHPRKYTK